MTVECDSFDIMMLIFIGIILGVALAYYVPSGIFIRADIAAEQICAELDHGLLDYKVEGGKFASIDCGERQLITGADPEKVRRLIEVVD